MNECFQKYVLIKCEKALYMISNSVYTNLPWDIVAHYGHNINDYSVNDHWYCVGKDMDEVKLEHIGVING